MNQSLEYNLPQNAYTNFDAVNLKDYMIKRLNENTLFTDQNYEGSNMSALIDILAYYTHVLLFYCNQNGAESLFSQTSIYENMNRIVNLIGYKPTGKQTSLVPVKCISDANLLPGNYLLRKNSYFLVDNIQYSLLEDVPFEKTNDSVEEIKSIEENVVLYQGTINEYPIYTSEGLEYETFPIVVDNLVDTNDTKFIAHRTIQVYVYENDSSKWKEYTEVDSLFLSNAKSRIYECRLNENGHYELKFGNDTYGRKLKNSDRVAVYYILSDGISGSISKNAINGNKLFSFNTNQWNTIYNDISTVNTSELITLSNVSSLTFSNTSNSTPPHDAESVEQIRQNAPILGTSQLRLVTSEDYKTYLLKSIPNILNSVEVVNNNQYITEYINYFYNLCIDPNKVNRVILNQVNFADTCDFNNINIFCAPYFKLSQDESYPDYVSNSFKNLIIDLCSDNKMSTNEIVPRDPVYTAFDIGFSNLTPTKEVYSDTILYVSREKNNKINKETIKKRVIDVILNFFDPSNNELGQKIDISDLSSKILSLDGVESIRTTNTKENVSFFGISFISWNPLFEGVDESFINQTTTLPFFKFPYLYRPNSIANRIQVIDE